MARVTAVSYTHLDVYKRQANRDFKKPLHILISCGVGLFSGGAQRTTLEIITFFNSMPSLGSALYSPNIRPNFLSV